MRSAWLVVVCVLLGVLAPTAAVLWLINEAAASQAASARQNAVAAYRGQLALLREKADRFWVARASALDSKAGGEAFHQLTTSGLADSAILPAYPDEPPMPEVDPLLRYPEGRSAAVLEQQPGRLKDAAAAYSRLSAAQPSVAAEAVQAQIRCMVRSGDKRGALELIRVRFTHGALMPARDASGRSIAADEQLLALQLMKPSNAWFRESVDRLATLLNDYRGTPMPSAQRLFLMDELSSRCKGSVQLPTLEAEQLAARFIASGDTLPAGKGIESARMPGIWKLRSADGRSMALYRTETVLATTRGLLDSTHGVNVTITPPGRAAEGEAVTAGELMPGWQLSLSLPDATAADALARRRIATYGWVGFLVIAVMALSGAVVGQHLRRQWRLGQMKADLVATVSHELKNPLASMRVIVDSLLADQPLNAVKTRDYLELMADENARLTRLIENLLTYSRMERNRQRFMFAATKPADIVGSAMRLASDRLRDVEVDVTPDLPPVYADAEALVAALLNLLDNANKYTPGDQRISVHAYKEHAVVVLAVKDNGIGIAPKEHKRIFRSFYQVDQRLARETGGCGLGLSIVEFIVRAHGGQVRVDSRLGQGSTFRILLPAMRGVAA